MSDYTNGSGGEDVAMKTHTIETTIGDLICAISDAAEEAQIVESEIAELTQQVLANLLSE